MLVDKQSELMSDLLFTVHQHGGDNVKTTYNFFQCLIITHFVENIVFSTLSDSVWKAKFEV